ncbi:MAG: SOS response-associated peptidase family protein [Ferruginibacter sp.]
MCYDISFTADVKELADYFPEMILDSQLNIDFGNIDHIQGVSLFPDHPIIYFDRENRKVSCRPMSWSCIPESSKTMPSMVTRNGRLNIRSERILNEPDSYWHKIRHARCLIPVTGIYEHQHVASINKIVPYIIKPKDQHIFFLPGLYTRSNLLNGQTGIKQPFWSFGMITTRANEIMKTIHNAKPADPRMPLFLPIDLSKEFLQDELADMDYRRILEYSMPPQSLDYKTVFTIRGSKLRPDGKSRDELYEWNIPPELF